MAAALVTMALDPIQLLINYVSIIADVISVLLLPHELSASGLYAIVTPVNNKIDILHKIMRTHKHFVTTVCRAHTYSSTS